MPYGRRHMYTLGSACLLMLGAACAAQLPAESDDPSDQVALVSQALSASATKVVSFRQLTADFPAEVAAQVDVAGLRAADVVGWYDKGHNFHEQKMEKNLKSEFGDLVTNPAVLHGQVIQATELGF